MTFIESVEAALDCDQFKDRIALIDNYHRLTFAQVRDAVHETRRWLRYKGCKRGDRIAALTFSCIQAVVLEWATYKLGGIWVGIPWRERRPEIIVSILKGCRPKLFFLDPAALQVSDTDFLLKSSGLKLQNIGKLAHLECFQLPLSTQWYKKVSFKIDGENIVRIRFTSGVSGQPKGIIYTQNTQQAILNMISGKIIKGKNETMIHGAPIVWASGSLLVPVLCSGGRNVLRDKWMTESFVETVWREECTLTFLNPKMLSSLVEHSERYGTEWATSLRRVLVAGGPTPLLTMSKARKLFGECDFYTTLGMTEASFPITWHKVTASDVDNRRNRRPYVPLGPLTSFYKKSRILGGANCGELMVQGQRPSNAVAPGKWIWLDRDGRPLKFSRSERLKIPYQSGDVVDRKGRTFHYLCRKDESCINQKNLIATDAVEALLRECSGVKEARIDRIWPGQPTRVDVTIKTDSKSLAEQEIRCFFKRNASKANLRRIDVGTVRFGKIEMTASGKLIHNKRLYVGKFFGGLVKPTSQPWEPFVMGGAKQEQFAFSEIKSGSLYFYVGAGLSMSSGLVGWGEMASLVWWYLRDYERRDRLEACPCDIGEANERFLHRFVTQEKILSHDSEDLLGLGRTVLLNLLLRYRAPKSVLRMGARETSRMLARDRTRYGKEPNAEDLVLQSLIWRTHCHGVLTSNYDMLLEHAFSLFNHGAALRSYRYNADFLRYIMSNRRFVLKLHGDINDIGRMQLAPAEAWNENNELFNPYGNDLKRVYCTALQRGHMVYIGMGFRDATIVQLHEAWRNKNQPSGHLRIALVPYWELDEIKRNLGDRTNLFDDILFLTYGGKQADGMVRDHALRSFLLQVVEARSDHIRDESSTCLEARELHRQIFLSSPDERLSQKCRTQLWSCDDIEMDAENGALPS